MFRTRIRELREAKGFKTQADFAKAVNVAQPTVAHWEAGDRQPGQKKTAELADFFGVTVDYLLGRDDGKAPLPQEAAREVLAGEGIRILLDGDPGLTEDQLNEIVEFIKFKRRTENR